MSSAYSAMEIRPATVASLAGHSEQFTELDTEVVVELVGIEYGPQEATVNDMVHDSLDLRLRMLGEDAAEVQLMLYDVVRSADQAVWALGRMAANIASAAGDFDGVDGARDRARETAWAELDHPARSPQRRGQAARGHVRVVVELQQPLGRRAVDHRLDVGAAMGQLQVGPRDQRRLTPRIAPTTRTGGSAGGACAGEARWATGRDGCQEDGACSRPAC